MLPTHYVLNNSGRVFVKDADFFASQGGLTQSWGKNWRPVIANDLDEAARIAKAMTPTQTEEHIWTCKIGGPVAILPEVAADASMRHAVEKAFEEITGISPKFTFSGWGENLNDTERRVVNHAGPIAHTPDFTADRKQKVKGAKSPVSLPELLDTLKEYVVECDRPRGKFEAEHLYDTATKFFKNPRRNYELLAPLEEAIERWATGRSPSKMTRTSKDLLDTVQRYLNDD